MRVDRWLASLTCVLLAASLAGCRGGNGDDAVVKISPPGSTTAAHAPVSSPTPPGTPAPPPDVIVSATSISQASAVLVSVVGDITGGSITFINRQYRLTQGSQSMYAFIGVDADDPPSTYPVKIDFTLKNGSKGTISQTITVAATRWPSDSVVIPGSLAALLDPAVQNAETAQLAEFYGGFTPRKLWTGAWQVPVNGPVTTRFGEQRSYNGGPVSGHHSGTDLGAEIGAPVVATNSGKVVMSRQLRVHGNMVVIDHGGGVYSGYAHLSSFAVAEGQPVNAGDIIGYVGSSGLSTGAHLHWEMSVGGVLVDPMKFTDGADGF